MSKVNRRKEIKEKEELAAKFQMAMGKNNNMAMKWLNITPESTKPTPNNSFFDLPIIPYGASLSNVTLLKSAKSIGDFVNGTEIKPDMKPQPKTHQSKPMAALMNKMRAQTRTRIEKQDKNKDKLSYKNTVKKPILKSIADDSDLDSDVKSRSVKKGHTLVFDKKKKGRPF